MAKDKITAIQVRAHSLKTGWGEHVFRVGEVATVVANGKAVHLCERVPVEESRVVRITHPFIELADGSRWSTIDLGPYPKRERPRFSRSFRRLHQGALLTQARSAAAPLAAANPVAQEIYRLAQELELATTGQSSVSVADDYLRKLQEELAKLDDVLAPYGRHEPCGAPVTKDGECPTWCDQ